jgi:LmbE family N-acetylglucosaminyl deacetylase
MPTRGAALFLFAHQDDEVGVFHRISECVQSGLLVRCVYLTDGSNAGATPAQRNRESLRVLSQLGVLSEGVVFAGGVMSIGGGELPHRLEEAGGWLRRWLGSFIDIDSIHVPAWEGGHHDHDALHALAVRIASELNVLNRVWQFSLYHGKGCIYPFFKVLTPLHENGVVAATRIPWSVRGRYLRFCLSYPAQYKTWIGLFPFVLLHYLRRGMQELQPVSVQRLAERPHPGLLYYEHRKFFTWPSMRACLDGWYQGGNLDQ